MIDTLFFNTAEIKRSFRAFHARKRSAAFDLDKRGEPTLNSLIQNHEALLKAAIAAIKVGQYELGVATAHTISTDKERTIHHFGWLDTFILFHFARCIAVLSEKILPESVYSFRRGKSAALALSRLHSYLRDCKAPVYIIRRDVKNFGDEMAHSHLVSDLLRHLTLGKQLIALFEQICRFKSESQGGLSVNSRGLPGGHFIQLVCENLYLLELDLKLKQLGPSLSLRFGDDILFASTEREFALAARSEVDNYLRSRMVSVNLQKSGELVLRDLSAVSAAAHSQDRDFCAVTNFSYLGSQVFWNGEIAIPAKKLRALRAGLRNRIAAALRALAPNAEADSKLEIAVCAARNLLSTKQSLNYASSPLKILFQEAHNERQLRELDRWLALSIIKSSFRKGFKRGYFRRYAPQKLRELGLPSMLHLRRTRAAR